MKILQIRGEFRDNGPGTQSLTLSNELKNRGHYVEFCSSGGVLVKIIQGQGFKHHFIDELALEKRGLINVFKAIFKLKKILRSNHFDIIHAHNAATLYIAYISSILIGKRKSIKFFHSNRGVEIRKKYQWRNWIYKKYPAKIFAVSKFTKDILLSFGVKDKQVVITYNGVDLKRFDIEKRDVYRKEVRKEFGIPEDSVVIGIIGAINNDIVKGHDLLLKAFKNLYEKRSNLFLIVVGGGDGLESVKNLSVELEITDRVVITGLRTDAEKLHAAFDVFALLSKRGEMFPNAILESMSYENPFVSVNLSGIPEMALNNEGIICKVNDLDDITNALDKLVLDKNLRKKMGENGRNSILNKFNIQKVVDIIENEYKK